MNHENGVDDEISLSHERHAADVNQNRKIKAERSLDSEDSNRDVLHISKENQKNKKSLFEKKSESTLKSPTAMTSPRAAKSPKATETTSLLTPRSNTSMPTEKRSPLAAKSSRTAPSKSVDSETVALSGQSALRKSGRMLHGRKIPSVILLCRVPDLAKLLEKVGHSWLTQTIFNLWFLETVRELRRKPFVPSFVSNFSGLAGLGSILGERDVSTTELPLVARGDRPDFDSTMGFLFDSADNGMRDHVVAERRQEWENSGRRPALSGSEEHLFGGFFAFAAELLNPLTLSEFAIGPHAVVEDFGKSLRYAFTQRDFDSKMRLTPAAFRRKQEKAGCFALTANSLYTIDASTWYFQLEITDSEGREGPSENGLVIGFSAHDTPPLGATAADEIPDVVMCGYEGALFDGVRWSPIFWRPRELCPGDCVGVLLKPPSEEGKRYTFMLYVNDTIEVETKVEFALPSSRKVYGLVELLGNTHAVKIDAGVPVMSTDSAHEDASSAAFEQAAREPDRYSFNLSWG